MNEITTKLQAFLANKQTITEAKYLRLIQSKDLKMILDVLEKKMVNKAEMSKAFANNNIKNWGNIVTDINFTGYQFNSNAIIGTYETTSTTNENLPVYVIYDVNSNKYLGAYSV